jgi:hypothetical protein
MLEFFLNNLRRSTKFGGIGEGKNLYLRNTDITDAELVHLEGLVELKSLFIISKDITDAGATKLKAALPKCTIRH